MLVGILMCSGAMTVTGRLSVLMRRGRGHRPGRSSVLTFNKEHGGTKEAAHWRAQAAVWRVAFKRVARMYT